MCSEIKKKSFAVFSTFTAFLKLKFFPIFFSKQTRAFDFFNTTLPTAQFANLYEAVATNQGTKHPPQVSGSRVNGWR